MTDSDDAAELERLRAEVAALKAQLQGSGAIAQHGGVAAGAGGQAAGRDINNYARPAPGADAATLRTAYLHRIVSQTESLALSGVDPALASDREARLRLDAVYTALRTTGSVFRILKKADDFEVKLFPTSVLAQLDDKVRLVLLGDPGSGKSTFVSFLALCMAGEALGRSDVNLKVLRAPLAQEEEGARQEGPRPELQPWRHGALLPVRIVLRDLAAVGLPGPGEEATARHVWDFLERDLEESGLGEYTPHLKEELLSQGGLVLLDGLDEVPEAETRREQIWQAVTSFSRILGRCRILLTSRTYAYRNQEWKLPGFEDTELAPFSDGQIRQFISRWYDQMAALGRLPQEDAQGRAALLRRAVFSGDRLLSLARRPLLLTLMASLHAWRGGSLPERREELYAGAVDLLLDAWERQRVRINARGELMLPQPSLSEFLDVGREKVRAVLEELACECHGSQADIAGTADLAEERLVVSLLRLSNNPEARPRLLVEYLRDRAGLLEPRGVGVYTFPHRTFQEYLAACHLTGESWPDRLAELGRNDPARWREVVLLAGAKAARGAVASVWQIAEALCPFEPDAPGSGLADAWGAHLAGQVVAESADLARLSPANLPKLDRLKRWLIQLLRDSRFPVTERVLAGRTLAKLGDPRFDPNRWFLPHEPLLGLVEIPEGGFWMGSSPDTKWEDELPQHRVTLPTFYMARYPVTVQQFASFVQESGFKLNNVGALQGLPNEPVRYVTWMEALCYCRWLGEKLRIEANRICQEGGWGLDFWIGLAGGRLVVTLPSEAEWEKAARGAPRDSYSSSHWESFDVWRLYPWGDKAEEDRANTAETGIGEVSSVGCFPAGASRYGCEDLSGNVFEWTRSAWKAYPYDAVDGREEPGVPLNRVVRGGSYLMDSGCARCAYRGKSEEILTFDGMGFRIAVVPGGRTGASLRHGESDPGTP